MESSETKPDEAVGVLLSSCTTIGIGGPVPLVAYPRSPAEVRTLIASAGEPFLTLGAGSNLLAADAGVDRKVICLKKNMGKVMFSSAGSVVAEGGTMLPRLAVLCGLSGLSGIEELAGIPGTVGGALTMNAGAYGRSVGETVDWVEIVDAAGALHRIGARDIGFAYRDADYPVEGVIVRAAFRLAPSTPDAVFSRMKEINEKRRESQPWGERTFGSTFLRPEGPLSAGELLERAGMKGFRVGDAAFSRKHANFIVNIGSATAADVMRLIARGREAVRAMAGVELVPEVRIWGAIHE
ncbi:MAG TPA: UDP-N-acetylmuramate dehydrogenase [Candidatus Deferrimicrobiaceae bacterium]|jgi:UDP-N-acetylmuramate dehydrogenase